MKVTKAQLRRLIREAVGADMTDPLVTGWMRMLTRYPDFSAELHDAWNNMTSDVPRDQVVRQFQAAVGYKKPELGTLHDRGDADDLAALVGGVSFHARKIRPGKSYPGVDEMEQEIVRQSTSRRDAPRTPSEPPMYGPGGSNERWN